VALRALQHLDSKAGRIRVVTLATPFLRVFARRSLQLSYWVKLFMFGAIFIILFASLLVLDSIVSETVGLEILLAVRQIADNDDLVFLKARAKNALRDGGRTVGRFVGVQLEGRRDIMRSVTVHMTADLSPWLRDDDVLIRWIVHTRYGGAFSALVPMGPERWGPRSEEWVFHLTFPYGDPRVSDDDAVMEQMRRVLGIRDFHPD
jgi:hypothetical protein